MRKCKASEVDLLLGRLNLCNTLTESLNTSPAPRLLRKCTNSMVPMAETLLKLNYPYSYKEAKNKEGRELKQQVTGRELSQLHIGDNVQVQPLRPRSREWEEATINTIRSGECKWTDIPTPQKLLTPNIAVDALLAR